MRALPRSRRLPGRAFELAGLAAVAYIPLLLTKVGMLAADTKQYLYLDPGRLLESALSNWDPSVAGGTVTHQNIGYLFPQGPFYFVLEAWLRLPPWVAQRLWMASLLFVAGAGIAYLGRLVGLGQPGVFVAALAYELSPYTMQYIGRISAILMPWAALGWMLSFTILALRRGGWRYPALFALFAAAAGGTNASSIIFVGLAPVAWIIWAVAATREVTAGVALKATARIGLLTLGTALWWAAGLRTEGAFGIDVLIYTETLPAIASSSTAIEVLRGLGYWYFYGADRLGPWLGAAVDYEERVGLLVTSYLLPALGVLSAALVRWRERAYFVFIALIGLVLAVGTHPFDHPSLFGRGLKSFMTETTAGLALRSSDRATPLVVLGLTVLLGAGLSALWSRLRAAGLLATGLTLGLVLANAAPLFGGAAVARNFERRSHLPAYDYAAARYLDAQGNRTRVLIEPGQSFAQYTYGDTVDPIWPGLLTRPSIQRQQLIDGSLATADLLGAFDRTIQQGTYQPSTLAPIARLLSAGDLLFQSDLAFWRYGSPLPKAAWAAMNPPPPGVGHPVTFGRRRPNIAPAGDRFVDEQALSLPAGQPWPPPLAVFPISHARPIYRTEPASSPLVLDGSGAGLVAAAAAGLLARNPTILYAATLARSKAARAVASRPGAVYVLTDSNRKALLRFESENDNVGETLPVRPGPSSYDPTQVPLDPFGRQPARAMTIAQYTGAVYVTASSYGNAVAETPEYRPYMAFDSNPTTAWSTAAFASARGQWLQVKLARATTADHLRLTQVLGSSQNRFITAVTLSFDGGRKVRVALARSSRRPGGEVVSFPPRRFRVLRIRIDATSWRGRNLTGASGVGFSSVVIPGVHIFEWIRLPEDLLAREKAASSSHRLVVILTRRRLSPFPPGSDPEPFLARRFYLPTGRRFSLSGTARISALIPDNVIDTLLGGPHVFGGAVIGSNERLPGDLNARAAFAFDGNPHTAWMPGFDRYAQQHAWVEASLPHPITFDHMDLEVLADKRHSIPTAIRITSNTGQSRLVRLPPAPVSSRAGAVARLPVRFAPISGSTFRFSIVSFRAFTTINWYSERPIVLPIGIAEMGVPGIHVTPERPSQMIPAVCRHNLLRIDGRPVSLEITGRVGTAEASGGLSVRGCGRDAGGLYLAKGMQSLVATDGQISGFNLDQLVLDSAPGGSAEPAGPGGTSRPVAGTIGPRPLASPATVVRSSGPDSARLLVRHVVAGHPFFLVLGQSYNKGWTATVGGRGLGPPLLLDGYANGWYVDPARSGTLAVSLYYSPQTLVSAGLGVSAAFLLFCVLLAVLPERARRALRSRIGAGGDHRARAPEADGLSASPAPSLAEGGTGRARLGSLFGLALLAGGLSYAILPVAVALPGAVAVLALSGAGAVWPMVRRLSGLAAFACVAAAGGLVVYHQVSYHPPAGSGWPVQLSTAGTVAFVGMALLLGDAVAEAARRRQAAAGAAGGEPPQAG